MKNKKGIFITLIALFIVTVFLVIGSISLKNERTGYQKNIIKDKFMMYDKFVDRLVEKNIPIAIKNVAKESLVNLSMLVVDTTINPNDVYFDDNLTTIMNTGNLSDINITDMTFKERIELVHRLNYLRDVEYNITVLNMSVKQIDYRTVNVDFWVNYTVNFSINQYHRVFNDSVEFFVYGFKSVDGYVKNTWVQNGTNTSCILGEISNSYVCTGNAYQIIPP